MLPLFPLLFSHFYRSPVETKMNESVGKSLDDRLNMEPVLWRLPLEFQRQDWHLLFEINWGKRVRPC
ncbi:hypothetical protein EMPG_11281 [Blastomyces silverae]|uniref:Uncharacterized protein n=1 Tax=Blastomyces silverae TaxID=2060906 RepID=A0A0H1BRY0_9EURO|nr:hypothetical protein EMPG_11281 [Blastomyces silverae]